MTRTLERMNIRVSILMAMLLGLTSRAASTIDSANRHAYGANVGWVDWRGDGANGAVIGQYFCSGYIYSANVGWINLGAANPADGIHYQNNSGADFGVNVDGAGNLSGYAWGANIGWITFENGGAPRVDLLTGRLSGYAWSANCGWISLSNAAAHVQTDALSPGPLDSNGLPSAWELTYFHTTGVDPNADADHDGASNGQEYLAGTNPTNATDFLRITTAEFSRSGATNTLTWTSKPTRLYSIQEAPDLAAPAWSDIGLGLIAPGGALTTMTFSTTNAPARFYRIRAVQPLSP